MLARTISTLIQIPLRSSRAGNIDDAPTPMSHNPPTSMATKKNASTPLTGKALTKEVCRLIRLARSHWDAHRNHACRGERERALTLYQQLTDTEKDQIPQVLRVWLRYRSEKYFGPDRTPPGKHRS